MYQHKDLYIIDFSNVNYYFEMHQIIKEALDWPDYYGCNWDACWDCLTDMVGRKIHIEIRGLDVIERKFGEEAHVLFDILKEFKHYGNNRYAEDIQIEIVSGDIRISLQ